MLTKKIQVNSPFRETLIMSDDSEKFDITDSEESNHP